MVIIIDCLAIILALIALKIASNALREAKSSQLAAKDYFTSYRDDVLTAFNKAIQDGRIKTEADRRNQDGANDGD